MNFLKKICFSPNYEDTNETCMEIYNKTLHGEIASKYAFFVDFVTHAFWNLTFNNSLPIMENEVLIKSVGIEIPNQNLLMHATVNVITSDQLILIS